MIVIENKTLILQRPNKNRINMKIPTKFELNMDDFKVYFDNNRKTHVCKSISTGEETNVGVLGVLMQMGIIKPIEESIEVDKKLSTLLVRVEGLESKLNDLHKKIETLEKGPVEKEEEVVIEEKKPQEEELKEEMVEEPLIKEVEPMVEEKKEGLKTDIKEHIMEKAIEEAKKEEPAEDVNVESKEEIDNWMEI